MTLFSGVDIGTESVKIVVTDGREVRFSRVEVTEEAGRAVSQRLLAQAVGHVRSLFPLDLVATGIGKKTVAFARQQISDQVSHALGAHWLFQGARTVLDMGASGSRVMRLNDKGKLLDFAVNSRCASGTGAFLQSMSKLIDASFEEMSKLTESVQEGARISNYCTVFAESEVISQIHTGESKARIAAGMYEAVVERMLDLLNQVGGIQEELVVTGGVALNDGLIRALEKRVKIHIRIPQDPRIVGALGAALTARDLAEAGSMNGILNGRSRN